MTYNEFKRESTKYINGYIPCDIEEIKEVGSNRRLAGKTKDYVVQSWLSGGMSGGNCWGGSADRSVDGDTPPKSFEELNKLLSEICPTLPFLKYLDIIDNLVQSGTDTKYEYYGNYYEYSYNVILLQDLYNFLNSENLLGEIQ
jgi:hypothetical protein